MTDIAVRSKSPWQRFTIFALAGLQIVLFTIIWADFLLRAPQMELITRSMSQGFSLMLIVPFVMMTIPALVLAILRRWLVLALILAVLPILAVSGLLALIHFR